MTNYSTVNSAVKLVVDYFEFVLRATVNNQVIEKQALDWYNHVEINSPEMLAGLVIRYGDYTFKTNYEDMVECEEMFLDPTPPEDSFFYDDGDIYDYQDNEDITEEYEEF